MNFDRLLTQPLIIHRRMGVSTDQYGNEVSGTASSTPTTGYVEQTSATEVTVNRETYTTDWLVVLRPGEVDGSDRIVYGARTLEVVGPPNPVWNPRTRTTSHIECRCRETTG